MRAVCSRPVSCSHNGRHAVSSAAGVVSGSVSGAVATCSATFTEPQSSAAQNSQVSNSSMDNDCPVCLQPFSHPIKLPCSHVFCYLCAKGFASQHGRYIKDSYQNIINFLQYYCFVFHTLIPNEIYEAPSKLFCCNLR